MCHYSNKKKGYTPTVQSAIVRQHLIVLFRDAYFLISCDHKPVFYCLLLSSLLNSNGKSVGCTNRRWTTQVCNPSCQCCASSKHKNQSLPSECGHPGCKAKDYTTKCSSRIGGGEKNQFWASIDRQQLASRNGWFEKSSPRNRTSKDQRPRGESEEARWDREENWAAAKPKWTKLSIWWSGLVAFGWPSSFAELSWWKLSFVVSGQLCCLGKLYGLNSGFWIVMWILKCYCFAELSCEFCINLVIMAMMWILD